MEKPHGFEPEVKRTHWRVVTSDERWVVATLERATHVFRQAECNGTRALRQQEASLKANIKSLCARRCNVSGRKQTRRGGRISFVLSFPAHCRWDPKVAPEARNLALALDIRPLQPSEREKEQWCSHESNQHNYQCHPPGRAAGRTSNLRSSR